MNEIMTLKENHIKISDLQVKDLLQNQIKLIDHIKNKRNQDFSEDGIKITDLTSKITSMRDTLQSEKQTLEYKNHVLSKHLDHITELDAEKNKFLEECQQLELQRNKLKTCKRNIQDQELLDQGRRKYALYRELTGIRWDFGKLKENITGNIYKGVYIHHFSYSNEENTKDLNNLLWQEIYQSVIHNEHKNTYDKENTVQNK
ncbi:uncharacterized protein LOC117233798 [Bombus vosnesenskii]|uniref:Uncharacterized protein LOC117233798 n=2 Tax=Pyrobombus TaxID=144703 RepID=A0A6J3KAY9_9HYME|nr:uncharacterized protein LOC105681138 [Bombus impatiens]XP_033350278.1 uncharacterized protein LOC117233798 [Bombus vosnesenskii]XP_050496465.1 uncharacterized protein LOC126878071 isoform X2 [Bombus huntii]